MELVCKDDDGDWYYYPEELGYRRLKGEEIRGNVKGEYLPNPAFLLSKRRSLLPDAPLESINPTQATYALWEHWNKVNATR